MPRDRDVAAFAERAEGYEDGWRGRLHHEISDRTAHLALAQVPAPHRVLDVGCGTGYLLRQLAARAPDAVELVGVDAAAPMVRVAQESTADPRVRFHAATAEHLPEPDGVFDLVVSTTSFDHWADQEAGLRECARVMAPGAASSWSTSSRRCTCLPSSAAAGARPARGAGPCACWPGPGSSRRNGMSCMPSSSGRSRRRSDALLRMPRSGSTTHVEVTHAASYARRCQRGR